MIEVVKNMNLQLLVYLKFSNSLIIANSELMIFVIQKIKIPVLNFKN